MFLEQEAAMIISGTAFGEQAQAGGIRIQAITQALVGDVDEGHEALRFGHVGDNAPLLRRQVRAAGVVTTAVEKNEIAGTSACFRSSTMASKSTP
jgi:hypothetical protein